MPKKQSTKPAEAFSDAERAAMQERARELKAEARASKNREAGEQTVLAKIAEMPEPDRTMATRIHEIVTQHAPLLVPRMWYGMPAYTRDGQVVCFFQSAAKFGARYATLGFNDAARLDEGGMWPTSYALKTLTPVEAARIEALVRRATADTAP
ncbi:MAG: DUF1801 domain-containing protein [Dehalococcoidia bacterium]